MVEALRNGRFYASTGVMIERIEVNGATIRIAAANAERIVALGAYGRRLKQADAQELVIEAPAEHPYVRFSSGAEANRLRGRSRFL